jgi:hypothetical protein
VTARSRRATSGSDTSGESLPAGLELFTPYLRPAPTFSRPQTQPALGGNSGVSAAVLVNRARRPARGLTEDWIRQHTDAELTGERLNWLSDGDNLESEDSSESGDWFAENLQARTPTLKTFVQRRSQVGDRVHHTRQRSNDTLKQEDFISESKMSNATDTTALEPLGELTIGRKESARKLVRHSRAPSTISQNDIRELEGKIQTSKNPSMESLTESPDTTIQSQDGLNVEVAFSAADKDLPPPPQTPVQKPAEKLEWRAASLPVPTGSAVEGVESLKSVSPGPGPVRLKKKIEWRGKKISILLPLDDERGQKGKAPVPMTPTDVDRMLREWQQLGYDIAGFNLGIADSADDAEIQGQSRRMWPTLEDIRRERALGNFRVNIPDRREWDAYVEELKEAKLRALGVSLGDDDPVISPPMPNLSRQTSTQYPPLPFSPPVPTSSTSSAKHQNPFSPTLMAGAGQSTSQSSNVGSVASPASMHAQMYGKYNPRQSIALSAGSPFQYGQVVSPGGWSPAQMLYQPGHARGGSPSIANLGAVISPVSSLGPDGYFSPGDLANQMQQRQQQLQNQLHQQMQRGQSVRQSPRLQDVTDDDEVKTIQKSPSKTPEASQFIRHNASESLQKEIDEAEYHLEEQFRSQLEGEDYSPHSEKQDNDSSLGDLPAKSEDPAASARRGLGASRYADSDGPVLHHPQPHSRGHSLSQRPFIESDGVHSPALKFFAPPDNTETPDLDTNPSTLDNSILSNDTSTISRGRSFSNSTNPWADSESVKSAEPVVEKRGHAYKPSMSKLNVAAPEFKFNPSSTFKPGNFSFGSGLFQPAAAPFVPAAAKSNHSVNSSVSGPRSSLISKINVAAPVFTPGQSEFSFSSSGPTFRPDAPAFTPISRPAGSVGSGQSGTEGSDMKKSIFGKIDMLSLAGIVKQPKKSKAIPIIRPDSVDNNKSTEDELTEDKDGRITQGEGRNKRARGLANDGDSVPLFATPSPEPSMPLQETTREQSPPKEVTPVPAKQTEQVDKENLPAGTEKDDLRIVPTPPAAKALRTQRLLEDSPDYDGKGWAPWEFDQQQQVQDFNTASSYPVPSPALFQPRNGNEHDADENEERSTAETPPAPEPIPTKVNGHKKNSLSALAKPFEFSAPSWFSFGSNSTPPKQAAPVPEPVAKPPPVPARNAGLRSSRFASSPPPLPLPKAADEAITSPDVPLATPEQTSFQSALPQPQSPPPYEGSPESEAVGDTEPTFEEIDAVMRHMNEAEAERSLEHDTDTPRWHQPSPARGFQMPDDINSSPIRMPPQNLLRSDAPSPSPRRFQPLPGGNGQRVFSRVHDDPFVTESLVGMAYESPVHNLNPRESLPASDWDDAVSESEDFKFQARTPFFDDRVNDLVGGLLSERLDPLEKVLQTIQSSLANMSRRTRSSRRTRRSLSGELPESDADDEDEEEQRSQSPRRDRKLEKIRAIVTEALAAHQPAPVTQAAPNTEDSSNVLRALEEMRDQFGQSMRLDLRAEDIRNVVEEAVKLRMPSPKVLDDEGASVKIAELESRIVELTQRAEKADEKTEEEVKNRRAAEDRLAEVQRLLRISSEEEVRLREAVEEKEQKLKAIEDSRSKSTMRTALLEANSQNAHKNQAEMLNKVNVLETDLRQARKDSQHWQVEAEKALEAAKRHNDDAEIANETNAQMRKTIESLKLQMEESLRVREGMRVKLAGLQEDMAMAAREISQENAKRFKKEQELLARQEVLDARLQAEARTRERLEREIERLENGERDGMRAVNESKRLEELLGALRNELHDAQKNAMRYQREFEEARESGLSEVQRTRHYMQAEIEAANNQVNMVRQDLEDQVARLRADLDQARLDGDTARARGDMLLEEAVESKRTEIQDLSRRHANQVEDMQTRHERDLENATENHQRSEQHLLERLSLSSAKMEHLQDRVSHLEEKLEISKAAALAAAQAARSAGASSPELSAKPVKPSQQAIARSMALPEKISPQALRESIMVLQEQLQEREQTIETLEQKLSTVDFDAPTKITKRDDEISWLRELLAVRVGDLQDIITHASAEEFDPLPVKDAAIRLKANLQMQMQERERAMSGFSGLPNIASSLRDAAMGTPRVAQVVGPMAAAWGNWRSKSQENANGTPSKGTASPQSFLSGLLTPPASVRTPPPGRGQPSAFNSTGRRLTAAQLAQLRRQERPGRPGSGSGLGSGSASGPGFGPALTVAKGKVVDAPPSTPPMMRKASYDDDAHARADDFGEGSFYDDEEDDSVGEGVGR